MRSNHELSGVRFALEWRMVNPDIWKITGVFLQGSKPIPSYPASLQSKVSDIDLTFRSWADGTITKLPLDLLDYDNVPLTDKRRTILQTLYDTVERGSVITYEALGVRSGLGSKAGRAIGNAMAGNPWSLFYPCHRVVRCDLSLGNYGLGGTKAKENLLRMEGVVIRNGICKSQILCCTLFKFSTEAKWEKFRWDKHRKSSETKFLHVYQFCHSMGGLGAD
jgi:O-6-methylguanine DNA methyltransferase